MDVAAQKLWPEALRNFVVRYPEEVIPAIVMAYSGKMESARAAILSSGGSFESVPEEKRVLNVIGSYALICSAGNLLSIARSESVKSIWFIHPTLFEKYLGIIRGIEDVIKTDIGIANLSLGVPSELLPMPFRPDEPLNQATKIAADHDILLVFAAGNGGPSENSLSPWGLAPWTMSIGASDESGEVLANFSGRGIPGDPVYRPTVVAPGIDIQVPVPYIIRTKSNRLKKKRRSSPPMSGTSFAAPQVSRIAAQIGYFLAEMRRDLIERGKKDPQAELTFAQIYRHNHLSNRDDRITSNRLVGELDIQAGYSIARYPIVPNPYVIKQIIMDMALDMPNYEPYQVGAGFVHLAVAMEYFGTFGRLNPPEIETLGIDIS